ncbi:hypothetical protein CR513_35762, partial [Mucuna pruriens]
MESKVEALEQQNQDLRSENTVNNGLVFNVSSGVDPNPKEDSEAQHHTSGNPPTFVTHRQASQSEEKWKSLEERLRASEGGDKYGLEAIDLCLVPDVGLPTNFKTLEFDKYKGSSYPCVHLALYCRKMAAYIYDDKVLIHCFQDSLTETALNWYVGLKRGHIKTWRDLVEAFLKQYKYNEDMALDRSRSRTWSKKNKKASKNTLSGGVSWQLRCNLLS